MTAAAPAIAIGVAWLPTSRLFRKTYKTLKFVEEEIVDRKIRCVFTKSHIDTDDNENWRKLLHVHGLVDELTIQLQVAHVRAAHEGQLRLGIVFGTLTYGFTGEPIPGQKTKLGNPARKLAIDPVTSKWVEKVFAWFTRQNVKIQEIARMLNDLNAPLPKRERVTRWTSRIVRRMLDNQRYIGNWEYGAKEAVWQNKADYARQFKREKPLCSMQFDYLRFIDQQTWDAAQKRLLELPNAGGRKPSDGGRISRPTALNRLCVCEKHDPRILYIGGNHGQYMFCPDCQVDPEPGLVSLLPRELATKNVCLAVASLIKSDPDLAMRAVEACRRFAGGLQKPDPAALQELRRQQTRLTEAIQFVLQCPGDTDQDWAENQARLLDLRRQRADVQEQLQKLEGALGKQFSIPTVEQVQKMLDDLADILTRAATSKDPETLAAARRIIEAVTGGKIIISQQGEAKRHRGWLRGTFQPKLLRPVLADLGIVADVEAHQVVHVDFRKVTEAEQLSDEVKALWDQKNPELLVKEIAVELSRRHGRKIGRNMVAKALAQWYESRGLPVPDGRARRSELEHKSLEPPLFERIADQVMELYNDGMLLSEIATRLDVDRNVVTWAVAHWHKKRGLPAPDGRTRRKRLEHKGRRKSTGWKPAAKADPVEPEGGVLPTRSDELPQAEDEEAP